MELYNGRPVITSEDHPVVIYRALKSTTMDVRAEAPNDDRANAWSKRAQDAYETVGDAFHCHFGEQIGEVPDTKTVIHVGLPQLELALTYYGLAHEDDPAELACVNELLISLDGIKNQHNSR